MNALKLRFVSWSPFVAIICWITLRRTLQWSQLQSSRALAKFIEPILPSLNHVQLTLKSWLKSWAKADGSPHRDDWDDRSDRSSDSSDRSHWESNRVTDASMNGSDKPGMIRHAWQQHARSLVITWSHHQCHWLTARASSHPDSERDGEEECVDDGDSDMSHAANWETESTASTLILGGEPHDDFFQWWFPPLWQFAEDWYMESIPRPKWWPKVQSDVGMPPCVAAMGIKNEQECLAVIT
jgi:hypothetical protein